MTVYVYDKIRGHVIEKPEPISGKFDFLPPSAELFSAMELLETMRKELPHG